MQGPRRDSDSADILTYFGEWHKSESPGYQPGNVLSEKAGEGYGPLPPPNPPAPPPPVRQGTCIANKKWWSEVWQLDNINISQVATNNMNCLFSYNTQ